MISEDKTTFVAEALADRLPELTDLVRRRLRNDLPEFSADVDPALAVSETGRIAAALRSLVEGIRGASEPAIAAVEDAQEEARAVAQAGIDLNLLVRTYRVAQAAILDVLLTEIVRLIPNEAEQVTVQERVAEFQFEWNETMLTAVVSAYQEARDSFFFHATDRQLRALLREVIAGETDDTHLIPFPVANPSIAAVVWGDAPLETTESVAGVLRSTHVLDVAGTSGARLVWFALSQNEEEIRSGIASKLRLRNDTFVSFGKPNAGLTGFRTSHHQAWRAYRVGRWTKSALTWYSDVALEALFMRDFQAARDFVQQQLGPLDLHDPRSGVLRETLTAYFDTGSSAVKAAKLLHVHERTVSYRLRTIEDKLGVSVSTRRGELLVALRLESSLRAISAADTLSRH